MWRDRIVLPVYDQHGHLIFYQGRSISGDKKAVKYLSCDSERSNVLFGMSHIFDRSRTDPIVVVEGIFDALSIDSGVALLTNQITKQQLSILKMSHRPIIYVPDIRGRGWVAAQTACDAGWGISIPNLGDCKDLNEAVIRYGKLFVNMKIHENIIFGTKAKALIKMRLK